MVFVFVMSWCTHVSKGTYQPSAEAIKRQSHLTARSRPSRGSAYFHTASGFSFAAGVPFATCSSRMVATSPSVTLEYQVLSG